MAHSIPSLVKLSDPHNKLIRVGKSRKRGSDFKASRDRSTMTTIDGKILDKPIQVYRMWYRYLQLALELERQEVSIVPRMEKRALKKPRKDAWGKMQTSEMVPVKRKIKVNKKKYEGWDIDSIPETSFDDWWFGGARGEKLKEHRDLFYPEASVQILDVKKRNYFAESKNYTYIRIDNRRRINDIEKELRILLADKDRNVQSVSPFPVQGTPNINTLINRYNALILQLTTTSTDAEMFAMDVFRPTRYGMELERDVAEEGAYSYKGSAGRAMRDLILPSKIALLSVCDGYFTFNPTKEY